MFRRVMVLGVVLLGLIAARNLPAENLADNNQEIGVAVSLRQPLFTTASRTEVGFPKPAIQFGCVLWNGLYVPPPYEISSEGNTVYLNGRVLPVVQSMSRPAQRPNSKSLPSQPRRGANQFAMLHRNLQSGGLLLIENDTAFMMRPDLTAPVMQVLFSDEDQPTKVKSLANLISSSTPVDISWNSIVKSFAYDSELSDKYLPKPTSSDESLLQVVSVGVRSMRYGMTVMGMMLGVFGFGMLLQHQPHVGQTKGVTKVRGTGFDLLPMYVLLVFVFSIFDLACTLFAHEAGGLLELNPLGSAAIERPWLVSTVKVSVTLGSVLILLKLREHRFAQVASWWLCLICVFLTLRWVSFNSMFLA